MISIKHFLQENGQVLTYEEFKENIVENEFPEFLSSFECHP